MYKVSELISTPIISIYESQNQGIIYNVLFDTKKRVAKYFSILNEADGIKKILKISDVYKIGKECIFIKNTSSLQLQNNFDRELGDFVNPINLKVYTMDGTSLGCSADVITDEKLNIVSIVLNDGKEIPSSKIFNIGTSIILISDKTNKISNFKPKNTIKINKANETKVVMLDTNENNEPESPVLNKTNVIDTNFSVNKIITDYRFLIGRILSKDIVAINGEIIARKNAIITNDIVGKASLFGKLVEIARYSNKKTNL